MFSILLVFVASVGLLMGASVMSVESLPSLEKMSLMIIALILGFILFPIKLVEKISGERVKFVPSEYFDGKRLIIELLIIFLVAYQRINFEGVVFYFVIAVCEEYLFGDLMLKVLNKSFSQKASVIIGALLFSLVLHLNDGFLVNLLFKFPISLVFYYLAIKFKLQDAIFYHWLHNIIVSII